MKKIKSILVPLYVIVFSLLSTTLFAQDPGFPIENDPGSAPAAPIDLWVLPVIVLLISYMFVYYRKQHKLEKQ